MRPLGEASHLHDLGRARARRTRHQVIDTLIMGCALGAQVDIVTVVGVAGAAAEGLVQIDEAGAPYASPKRYQGF